MESSVELESPTNGSNTMSPRLTEATFDITKASSTSIGATPLNTLPDPKSAGIWKQQQESTKRRDGGERREANISGKSQRMGKGLYHGVRVLVPTRPLPLFPPLDPALPPRKPLQKRSQSTTAGELLRSMSRAVRRSAIEAPVLWRRNALSTVPRCRGSVTFKRSSGVRSRLPVAMTSM